MNGKATQNLELLLESSNVTELRQIIEEALADQAHENEEWEKHFAEKRRECYLTEGEADRVVNDILKLREEYERVKAVSEKRLHDLKVEEKRLTFMWQPTLEAYTIKHRGKKKNVKLFSGIMKHHWQPERIEVQDDKALIEWAKMARQKKMLDWKPKIVKKEVDVYVQRTGELPPGCDERKGYDKFYIESL